MRVRLAYGRTGLEIELPRERTTVIEPLQAPVLRDPDAALTAALRQPVAGPPLRELAKPGQTAAISVCDITRAQPRREMVGAVLRELRRLQRNAVPAGELQTAKQSVLARFPLLFDRAEAIAGMYAEDELLGRPREYWARYRQRLHAVTAADIRRAARRFLDPGGVALLVVGDGNAVRDGRGFAELRRAVGQPRALGEQ